MATITTVKTIDDIDGSHDAKTIAFGFDGVEYEIDLSESNTAALREALAPYIDNGRRVVGRRGRTGSSKTSQPKADRELTIAIRKWAKATGRTVSDRGRLSGDVISAYHAAHQS